MRDFPTVNGGPDVVRVKLTTFYCIFKEKAVDVNEFGDRGEHLQGPTWVMHASTRGSGQVFLPVSQVDSACYVRSGWLFVALVCTKVQSYERRGF